MSALAPVPRSKLACLTGGYLPWVSAILSVLGARVFGSAAAFLANVLVARHLGPEHFNSFYLLFALLSIVAGLTGPAIDTSLVRFAVKHIQPGADHSAPYFKFVLYLKLAILVLTMGIALALAPPLRSALFVDTVPNQTILLAFFGGAVLSLWGFSQSYFQAHQRFTYFAVYEFSSAFLRLLLVILLIWLGTQAVSPFLLMYVVAPLVLGIIAWTQLPGEVFKTLTTWHVGREFLHFAKWMLITTLFATLTQRLDIILLNLERFGIPKGQIGHYGASVSIVLAGELVLLTFHNVLLPKASSLRTAGELSGFIRQFRVPSFLFCLATSALIPLAGPFCRLAFGGAYTDTKDYFIILLLGVLVSIFTAPAVAALYSMGTARTMAWLEVIRFGMTLVFGLCVIPRYGIYGMAWCTTLVRGGIGVAAYVVALQAVKRQMMREDPAEVS